MTAPREFGTTTHQPVQVAQEIVVDQLNQEIARAAVTVDVQWLLGRVLQVCDHAPRLRAQLRIAMAAGDGHDRRTLLESICCDPRVQHAAVMVTTLDAARDLANEADDASVEPERCQDGCGRIADAAGYAGVCRDLLGEVGA